MTLTALWNKVPVRGSYRTTRGEAVTGSVTFTLSHFGLSAADHEIVLPVPLTVALDVNGDFEADLLATDDPDITPTGLAWLVDEKFDNAAGRPRFAMVVPLAVAPVGIDMANVLPVIAGTPLAQYLLSSMLGQPNGVAMLDADGNIAAGLVTPGVYIELAELGQPGGPASLNDDGVVPDAQLPAQLLRAAPTGTAGAGLVLQTDGSAAWVTRLNVVELGGGVYRITGAGVSALGGNVFRITS